MSLFVRKDIFYQFQIWTKVIVIPAEDEEEKEVQSINFCAGEDEESIFLHKIQRLVGQTNEIRCNNVSFEYLIDRRCNQKQDFFFYFLSFLITTRSTKSDNLRYFYGILCKMTRCVGVF